MGPARGPFSSCGLATGATKGRDSGPGVHLHLRGEKHQNRGLLFLEKCPRNRDSSHVVQDTAKIMVLGP